MENQNVWAAQNKRQFLKTILAILGAELLLFAIGISFALIADGLVTAFLVLAICIQLVRYWLVSVFSISDLRWKQMPPMNLRRWIFFTWRMAFSLLIIIIGILLLRSQGFLGQNIFYLLFK
jgi:hypothetical protein